MSRKKILRLVGHTLRLTLFAILTAAALRFLFGTVGVMGWTPAASFALLLVAGSVALVWWAARDMKKAIRRAK